MKVLTLVKCITQDRIQNNCQKSHAFQWLKQGDLPANLKEAISFYPTSPLE